MDANDIIVSYLPLSISIGIDHYMSIIGDSIYEDDLVREWFDFASKIHRTDGPATLEFYPNSGGFDIEEWWNDSKIIHYQYNGQIRREIWCRHGKSYRLNGPAEIHYDTNGNIEIESWGETSDYYIGPTRIEYYSDGNFKLKEWKHPNNLINKVFACVNYNGFFYVMYRLNTGKWYYKLFHNSNGPACIKYYPNGHIMEEKYYYNNKLHRSDGPAIVKYTIRGDIESQSWWYNGVFQNLEDLSDDDDDSPYFDNQDDILERQAYTRCRYRHLLK